MKQFKTLFFLSLSFLSLTGMKTTSEATTTDGKINFTEGEGETSGPIKVIKPGTEKEMITISESYGNRTSGGLRFSFVPSFNFGEAEISVTDQVYYAKTIPYVLSNPSSSQKEQYIPPFLQVINESGENHQFAVYAWASSFKGTSGHELVDSRIKLSNFSGRNTILDKGSKGNPNEGLGNVDAVGSGYLKVPNLASMADKSVTIPTKQSDASFIFASNDGDKTRGSASSVVFAENYDPKNMYGKEEIMESIALHVPATDKPKKELYHSTIAWELEDTIR